MGLDVSVGYLSLLRGEEDDDFLDGVRDQFAALNRSLQAAGLDAHVEPESLTAERTYEDRVGGYGSLHHLRRLAAWLALKGRLPVPLAYQDRADSDPMVLAFYETHDAARRQANGWLARLLGQGGKPPPPYQHLMVHSDCEGYYLPQDFERVVVDASNADGSLQMIGSAPRLLAECRTLAEAIGLPPDIDPDDEDEVEPTPDQIRTQPWRAYPIEAYVLNRLIRACQASIESGAAVVFC